MKKFKLVMLVCFVARLQAQNIDYQAYFVNFSALETDCNSDDVVVELEEQHTFKAFISDDVNTSETQSGCQTCSAPRGCSINGDVYGNRWRGNTSARHLNVRLNAFENDAGDVCSFNSDDDCRVTPSRQYEMIPPDESGYFERIETLGSGPYSTTVAMKYRYATVPLNDVWWLPGATLTTGGDKPFWGARGNWDSNGVEWGLTGVSGTITHNQSSSMTLSVSDVSEVSFKWRVSSEVNFDYVFFYVDGQRRGSRSGEADWVTETVALDPCTSHELKWEYKKDGSVDEGQDRAFIDDIEFVEFEGYTEAGFGAESWNVSCYNKDGDYMGFYPNANLDISTVDSFMPASGPHTADEYEGCVVSTDEYGLVFQREGFPNRRYNLDVSHTEGLEIWKDDVLIYSSSGSGSALLEAGNFSSSTQIKAQTTLNGSAAVDVEFIYPDLNAGLVTSDMQRINPGSIPAPFGSQEDASGGGGNLTYQWEQSTDAHGLIWSPATGINYQKSYSPPELSERTRYHRRVYDDASNRYAYSNVITVEVNVIWENGSWSKGPSILDHVVLKSDYHVASQGVFLFKTLTIEPNTNLLIEDGSSFWMTGPIENNGHMEVASGSSLVANQIGVGVSGNDVLIRRNTRYSDDRYSFVGSPVEQISNVTATTLGQYVYTYDETQDYAVDDGINRWVPMAGELEPGIGYTQAFQQEIIFIGKPNTGNVQVSGTYSGTYDSENYSETDGWFLVANPYAAAIDVGSFLSHNDNLESSIYIWDGNGSGRGSNADYIVANSTAATSTAAGGQVRYNQHVGSAQGFFVKFKSDTDLEVEFTEAMQVGGQNSDDNFFRKGRPAIARVNLTNEKGLFRQTVLVQSDEVLASRMFDSTAPDMIATLDGNGAFAIKGVSKVIEEIVLGVHVSSTGNFTLSLETADWGEDGLYLTDKMHSATVDLTVEDYHFYSEAGAFVDRFSVSHHPPPLLAAEPQEGVEVYAVGKRLNVSTSQSDLKRFHLYTLSGHKIGEVEVKSKAMLDLNHLPDGIYIVSDELGYSKKVILK